MPHVQPEKVVAVSSCLDVSLIYSMRFAIHTVIEMVHSDFITWESEQTRTATASNVEKP